MRRSRGSRSLPSPPPQFRAHPPAAMRQFFVYVMASQSRRLYVGVTSDLRRRVWQHREGAFSAFTSEYRVTRLVYFESTADIRSAVAREKEIKAWPRARKIRLVEADNAGWRDLSEGWFERQATRPPEAQERRRPSCASEST